MCEKTNKVEACNYFLRYKSLIVSIFSSKKLSSKLHKIQDIIKIDNQDLETITCKKKYVKDNSNLIY